MQIGQNFASPVSKLIKSPMVRGATAEPSWGGGGGGKRKQNHADSLLDGAYCVTLWLTNFLQQARKAFNISFTHPWKQCLLQLNIPRFIFHGCK